MIDREAREQIRRATEAVRGFVLTAMDEGRVHPMALVMALAQAAGELEAGVAMDRGEAVDGALDELAKVLREAGREHAARLRGSVVGNA